MRFNPPAKTASDFRSQEFPRFWPYNQAKYPGKGSLLAGLKSFIVFAVITLLLAACSGILPQPAASATPSPVQTQVITSTATASTTPLTTPSPGNALWATYQSKTYNFSFEYPAIYELAPFKTTCGLRDLGPTLNLGARIEIVMYPVGSITLEDFTHEFLSTKDWVLENQDNGQLGGLNAININYQFGGLNRFGTLTLVKHSEVVVALGFTSGSFCADLPPEDDEASTYQHILDTFQFIK